MLPASFGSLQVRLRTAGLGRMLVARYHRTFLVAPLHWLSPALADPQCLERT